MEIDRKIPEQAVYFKTFGSELSRQIARQSEEGDALKIESVVMSEEGRGIHVGVQLQAEGRLDRTDPVWLAEIKAYGALHHSFPDGTFSPHVDIHDSSVGETNNPGDCSLDY